MAGLAAAATEPARSAAGYWAGQLSLPTGSLEIRVELSHIGESSWNGSIDVPAQGVRGFKLTVSIEGARVRFAMGGVPGEPTYTGTLSVDGSKIAGDFTQGNATFPFALQRTTAEALKAGPAVPAGIPGSGLAGHWLGVLKPTPSIMLRLALEVRNPDPTQLDVALVSIDQGNARMPAASLRESDGAVRLEFQRPVASFEGRFNADGSELSGTWNQANRNTPLTFKRQQERGGPTTAGAGEAAALSGA